ncbi:hypothetical protein J6590_041520, partial [Homalodisca vitripennis]
KHSTGSLKNLRKLAFVYNFRAINNIIEDAPCPSLNFALYNGHRKITRSSNVERGLLLGWVTAERSCPCKQPACPAIGCGSKVTFKPLKERQMEEGKREREMEERKREREREGGREGGRERERERETCIRFRVQLREEPIWRVTLEQPMRMGDVAKLLPNCNRRVTCQVVVDVLCDKVARACPFYWSPGPIPFHFLPPFCSCRDNNKLLLTSLHNTENTKQHMSLALGKVEDWLRMNTSDVTVQNREHYTSHVTRTRESGRLVENEYKTESTTQHMSLAPGKVEDWLRMNTSDVTVQNREHYTSHVTRTRESGRLVENEYK